MPEFGIKDAIKKALAAVVLLFSSLAWAGSDPNPADYTINVHVSSYARRAAL
jgi:hypothetical protein